MSKLPKGRKNRWGQILEGSRPPQNGFNLPNPFFFFFLLEEISTKSSAFCPELDELVLAAGFPFASSLVCCGGGSAVGSATAFCVAAFGSAATLGTSSPAAGACWSGAGGSTAGGAATAGSATFAGGSTTAAGGVSERG